MKIDPQRSAEQIGDALGKAVAAGKKAAEDAVSGAQSLVAKAQEENLKAQARKYNPVFPEQYRDVEFRLPNLIMIVDDAVRKGIDVCRGAVGWLSNQKGVEVLCLYDEAIEFSGLVFVPAAVCDSVYYVDPFDRRRFIRLDCYFDKMQKSKLAELQQIAFSLGASKYSVEMDDMSIEKRSESQRASAKQTIKGNASASEESDVSSEKSTKHKSLAYAEFGCDRQPEKPELHWFALDDNVRNLINMRCSGENRSGMKAYTMEFKGSDFATMGASAAAKIDGALGKLSVGSDFKMQKKVTEERHQKLIFKIEF